MIKIDTELFIQIISAEQGVDLVFQEEIEEDVIHHYKGPSGKIIIICVSDEFLSNRTAKAHLRQLGIDDLIVSLFPTDNGE
jgi:hypothetical protein